MVREHILWYSAEQSTAKENENTFYGKRTHSMCVTRSQRNAERKRKLFSMPYMYALYTDRSAMQKEKENARGSAPLSPRDTGTHSEKYSL